MILPPIGRVLNRFAHITHSREEGMRFAALVGCDPLFERRVDGWNGFTAVSA